MGHAISKLKEPFFLATENVTQIVRGGRGRKRKHIEEDSSEDITNALEKSLQVPKRKKLLSTTQYIYKALFQEEKNSDVTVMALGKSWHLHKVYLCQSPYFHSMFNGSWKESCEKFVHIRILDPKITLESLDTVFGSLYLDEIVIEPLSVISVLATATLFQLEGLIEKCAEVMQETTNAETAILYYDAGCQYGVQSVKKFSFNWLLINLLSLCNKHIKWLKLINLELMTDLVASPDLYVMQTEFSLYVLLRLWMFLKLFPNYEQLSTSSSNTSCSSNTNSNNSTESNSNSSSSSSSSNSSNSSSNYSNDNINANSSNSNSSINNNGNNIVIAAVAATVNHLSQNVPSTATTSTATNSNNHHNNIQNPQTYFAKRTDKTPFLLTSNGLPYRKLFQYLRIQHLISHHVDLKFIIEDNIIPKEWLYHNLLGHWNSVLKIDHTPYIGPENIEDDVFLKHCIRSGRILTEYTYHKWRWTGFNFGLDLVFIVNEKTLSIKRHHRAENERLLSLQGKRQFMIRIRVTSLNNQRQIVHTQSTDVKTLQLEKNEEIVLMMLDKDLICPLFISVNLLFITPPDDKYSQSLSLIDSAVVAGGVDGAAAAAAAAGASLAAAENQQHAANSSSSSHHIIPISEIGGANIDLDTIANNLHHA